MPPAAITACTPPDEAAATARGHEDPTLAQPTPSRLWTIQDAVDLYGIRNWGATYFGVNDRGNVAVHPDGPSGPAVDLKELVDELQRRGIGLPLLIRFNEILRSRIVELNEAFRRAIGEYGYSAPYKGVYPIKVNQHRYVVEEIVKAARPYHYGLEAGSKPELLAVMAMLDDPEALVVCNGYKDEEYVETALLASRLGRTIILVVEKPSELKLIHDVSRRTGIKPTIGIRAKLSTKGSGKWEASAGDRSKFGLSAGELLKAVDYLRSVDMLDSFQLLHFHLGSQISAIRSLKEALKEAGRYYVEIAKLGVPLQFLDVGGGLGVDYDGSQTNFPSSMNYTMQEYANDVVYGIKEQCDLGGVTHPTLLSESGRAVVAHHAVLVMDVLGVGEFDVQVPETLPENSHRIVRELHANWRELTRRNLLEAYHDAADDKDELLQLFTLGHLSLEQRVLAENIYWAICQKILRLAKEEKDFPEELDHLERTLSDTYFCNFSVFQSLPDSWAIEQLFPLMPIHRLAEEPTRRAVLADITCDSDGKIDRFIDKRDVKEVLELHPLGDDPYYLGIFLVGAYQEILGDLHNLFGDTNDVQVTINGAGGYFVEHVLAGDTVNEVLSYVAYNKDDLVMRLRRSVENALREGRMTLEESKVLLRTYEAGLAGYTYLEREG
jgi:arginine decarboxylase